MFLSLRKTRLCFDRNDFKTVHSTGPHNMDLSEDRELVYYLHQYNLARPSLLQAKSHAYLFLNYTGEPFRDSSSLCKHLGDLSDREVCIRVSTNVLRHSIVTYFKTLEDSEDLKIRESLARLIVSSSYRKNLLQDASLINVRWFS
jgi:site-specific recombinase XerD